MSLFNPYVLLGIVLAVLGSFGVGYYSGEQNEYEVYIPVDKYYLAPYAEFTEQSAAAANVDATAVTLQAADASQTLAALGVDDSLDFTMGVGPFTYDWYLNEVTEEAKLTDGENGTTISEDGRTLNVSLDNTDDRVVLVVTDTGKFAEPRTSETSYQLTEGPRTTSFDPANDIMLPFVVQ